MLYSRTLLSQNHPPKPPELGLAVAVLVDFAVEVDFVAGLDVVEELDLVVEVNFVEDVEVALIKEMGVDDFVKDVEVYVAEDADVSPDVALGSHKALSHG